MPNTRAPTSRPFAAAVLRTSLAAAPLFILACGSGADGRDMVRDAASEDAASTNALVCSEPIRVPLVDSVPGLTNPGDPDLQRLDDQWYLFFNAEIPGQPGPNVYAARMPPGTELAEGPLTWEVIPEPLVARVEGEWDAIGIETPSYALGHDPELGRMDARIYYTGYFSGAVWDNQEDLAIGYLYFDLEEMRWKRAGNPVLEGQEAWEYWNEHEFVGEPTVLFHEGAWHMWYAAGLPGTVGYATSSDGRTWTGRREVWEQAWFNLAALPSREGTAFIAGLLFESDEIPPSLVYLQTETLIGSDGDWARSQVLVTASGGPTWMSHRILSPSAAWEDEVLHVYFRGETSVGQSDIGYITCTR